MNAGHTHIGLLFLLQPQKCPNIDLFVYSWIFEASYMSSYMFDSPKYVRSNFTIIQLLVYPLNVVKIAAVPFSTFYLVILYSIISAIISLEVSE